MTERMYENAKTWSPFVGCRFNCSYCTPSFQRQMKRQKQNCGLCYRYEPHFHLERLKRVPNSKLIFACAFGDISSALAHELDKIVQVMARHPDKTFLLQSKSPGTFNRRRGYPSNVVIGTTAETTSNTQAISNAPSPMRRLDSLFAVRHNRKFITVEPIIEFDLEKFVQEIKLVAPEFVYIGYDSHNCGLPEPLLEKTLELIERLKGFTEVRTKLLREANNRRA